MEENPELEFSCGIIFRSLLMDCILTLPIKDLSLKKGDKPYETLRADVAQYCLKIIGDGTNHLINDAFKIEGKTREEQLKIAENLASLFPGMFETEANQKPKLKKAYKVTLASLVEDSNHEALITKDSIYQLYSFYSKYDHLSHWTSLSGKMPFDKRMDKIDLSIILTLFNLRDLLSIGYDFGNVNLKGLDKYCQILQDHLNKQYSTEIEQQ